MTLAEYLRLPWNIVRTEHSDDGEYVALSIAELTGFVVASRDTGELETMFWDALEAFLASYLDNGERPPLPTAMLPAAPQLELGLLQDVADPLPAVRLGRHATVTMGDDRRRRLIAA